MVFSLLDLDDFQFIPKLDQGEFVLAFDVELNQTPIDSIFEAAGFAGRQPHFNIDGDPFLEGGQFLIDPMNQAISVMGVAGI